MRKILPYILLIILVIPALACGSADEGAVENVTEDAVVDEQPAEDVEDAAAEETDEEEATDAETEGPTAEPEVEEAEVSVIPLEVLDPADPGMFAEIPEGSRLVGVKLVVENRSGEPMSVNPLNFTLRDQDGMVVESELAASDELAQLSTLTLYENERVSGWVFFVLEEAAQPTAIKMTENMFSSEGITVELADLQEPEWEPLADEPDTGLGETASENGVELSALSIIDPANPGILYTPAEGTHLIAVEVQIRNSGAAEPISVNPLYVYLVDNLGFVYEAELAGSEQEQISTLDLAEGEAVKGFVSYELPEGRTPLYIRYAPNLFDDNEYLEVGVTE